MFLVCVGFSLKVATCRIKGQEQVSISPVISQFGKCHSSGRPIAYGNVFRRWPEFYFFVSWVGLEMREGLWAPAYTFNIPLKKGK